MNKIIKTNTAHSVAQIAYLAALIDIKGSFHIVKVKPTKHNKKGHWLSMFKVSSCEKNVMIWLVDNFGKDDNSIYKNTNKNRHNIPMYSWHPKVKILNYIFNLVLPYLIIKKQHCEIFISYRTTSRNTGGKNLSDSIEKVRIELMKELNNINSSLYTKHNKRETDEFEPHSAS